MPDSHHHHHHGHDHHGHHQGHDQHRHAGHGHHHGPARHDVAFAVGVALNTGLVVAEVGFGLAAHSIALVADAMHNLGDVLGLLLAWAAAVLGRRPPSALRTYGWGRTSILAALINAALLLVAVGGIAVEAVRRLLHPEPVVGRTVVIVALAGILINTATALWFMRGRHADLNVRAAFLHMAGDALVSAGVVVAALLVGLTGWLSLDPLASLAIALLIAVGTWNVMRESLNLATDGVPGGVARDAVDSYLRAHDGVREVHDLHIWALSTSETALTAHLVCDPAAGPALLPLLCTDLRERFAIGHATIQIETTLQADGCRLRPDSVV